jgi:CPA2 family monovalent cation:H+ antiporter-2
MLATAVAPPFLVQSVALVVAAAAIAYLSYRIGLVPIVGFLAAGVLIGPNALGLVSDRELVNASAEMGVILLLFTIGIEFSLEKLARIQTLIFGGGGLQVLLATVATMAALLPFGVDWRNGLFTGFLVSLSSTVIVLKLLGDRGESNTTFGQVSLGLLIFQDLAIVVMVLLVPMLSGTGGSALAIIWALGKALGIILAVLLVARRLMPPLLERVARTCSPELFLLTVIAICFGTAWLTSVAGVSLSLGAFLAGLLVSESRFSHHAFGEIMPLQILFSATFFVSIGMLLDPGFLAQHLPLVTGTVLFVLLIKSVTTAASVRALGYSWAVAAASGLMLAQIGEFSFVLNRAGDAVGLTPAGLGETGSQAFLAASVVLMVATPQLATLGARVGLKLEHQREVVDATEADEEELSSATFAHLSDHVVVAGYGVAARHLVQVLRGSHLPFVITTLSPGGAIEAEDAGLPVLRGDSARQHTLLAAGVDRAKMVVVADDDPATAEHVVAVARSLAPSARIVARTRFQSEGAGLRKVGADAVIAEESEGIVQLFADVLRMYGAQPDDIERHASALRHGGYEEFPQTDHGAGTMSPKSRNDIDPASAVTLTPAVGRCGHTTGIRGVHPSARGCEDCLRIGAAWVHLRICMTCGHVACCDSSPHRHATKHFHATSHPIVKSMEPGEQWGWCYVDEVTL